MTNKIVMILLTLLVCSAGFAQGDKQSSTTDPNSMFLVGPGAWITLQPYKGLHTTAYPIPMVIAVKAPFYFLIDTAGCRVFSDSNMTFDFIGKIRTDGYDADDSDDLDGMHNRHMSFDIGGDFGISTDWGDLHARILTDALSQHDGQEFRITYAKPFKFEQSKIKPFAGFAVLSDNLADYYYGVRNNEARPGRPAYNPGSSVNWFVGFEANHQLNDDWTLFTSITYYWLDDSIRNSPIVDRDYTMSILAGAMYKF
jgi:outer membrane protein